MDVVCVAWEHVFIDRGLTKPVSGPDVHPPRPCCFLAVGDNT